MVEAYIGIGSNLGDRRDLCSRALGLLGMLPQSRFIAYSSTYETEPVGNVGGPFLNLVARVDTELPIRHLMLILQETERGLGRDINLGRDSDLGCDITLSRDIERRSGPRTMDLDLLLYGDLIIHEGELVVPHPRLHERRFVLTPLAELTRNLVHPVLGQTVSTLLATLRDPHDVRRLDDPVLPWARDGGAHRMSYHRT